MLLPPSLSLSQSTPSRTGLSSPTSESLVSSLRFWSRMLRACSSDVAMYDSPPRRRAPRWPSRSHRRRTSGRRPSRRSRRHADTDAHAARAGARQPVGAVTQLLDHPGLAALDVDDDRHPRARVLPVRPHHALVRRDVVLGRPLRRRDGARAAADRGGEAGYRRGQVLAVVAVDEAQHQRADEDRDHGDHAEVLERPGTTVVEPEAPAPERACRDHSMNLSLRGGARASTVTVRRSEGRPARPHGSVRVLLVGLRAHSGHETRRGSRSASRDLRGRPLVEVRVRSLNPCVPSQSMRYSQGL